MSFATDSQRQGEGTPVGSAGLREGGRGPKLLRGSEQPSFLQPLPPPASDAVTRVNSEALELDLDHSYSEGILGETGPAVEMTPTGTDGVRRRRRSVRSISSEVRRTRSIGWSHADSTCSNTQWSLYGQLVKLQQDLKFRMVAEEQERRLPEPATRVVCCSCEVLLIRDVDPVKSTFHCRFNIFLEWLDAAAVGLPLGEIAEDRRKPIAVPEIALQNALSASSEQHSVPEVVQPDVGHVACKITYQAVVQMDLDMHLFPFDSQRLSLILGLRARKDRDRILSCQFCRVDRQIRLDEWRLLNSFAHADRNDGRARVQFGVVISRAHWYYTVNVLLTIFLITILSFMGYLLPVQYVFDRLRAGIAILFAQTTFRLSIENKLPMVAYSTAFDQYSTSCQLVVLAIVVLNVMASMLHQAGVPLDVVRLVDKGCSLVLGCLFVFGKLLWVVLVQRGKGEQEQSLRMALEDTGPPKNALKVAVEQVTPKVQEQVDSIVPHLHFCDQGERPLSNMPAMRAVSVQLKIWSIHNVDPISSTFDCMFTMYLEWLDAGAVGLPMHRKLCDSHLAQLDLPGIEIHNAVDYKEQDEPTAYVANPESGQVMLHRTYRARLQLHLNLRHFPFESQRLQVLLTMPHEQDCNRAFVCRGCIIAPGLRWLEEWSIGTTEAHAGYIDGAGMATFQVSIHRRFGFYLYSMLAVLFGISSLILMLFVIDVHDVEAFPDQAKLFMPLLMTYLAFKLSNSGKVPKVAYSTTFDRYVLACQALFFSTAFACAAAQLLALGEATKELSRPLQTNAFIVLVSMWLMANIYFVYVAWKGIQSKDGKGQAAAPALIRAGSKGISASFEQQCCALMPATFVGGLSSDSANSAVLLAVHVNHLHRISPATASFHADFVATLSWLDLAAAGCELGSTCSIDDPDGVRMPRLMIQNAIQTTMNVVEGPRVVCPSTGLVVCRMTFKAQLQMELDLTRFPVDEQRLAIVMLLPEPRDNQRHLYLECLNATNAVRTNEWSASSPISSASHSVFGARAVFGAVVRRSSRYYLMHLVSICLYSTWTMYVYVLDLQEFAERGKILVGVLLVQVVAKLAVGSKLPLSAHITFFDRYALSCLALVFGIAAGASLSRVLARTGAFCLSHEVVTRIDQLLGATVFTAWLLWIIAARWRLLQATGTSPRLAAALGVAPVALPEEVPTKDFEELWTAVNKYRRESNMETLAVPIVVPEQEDDTDAAPDHAVALGVKVWLITDVDTNAATFECKFHVFLDWFDDAAVGLPEGTRLEADGCELDLPELILANAISVMLEDRTDPEVVNRTTGHVACRIQYHAILSMDLDLRRFPFDCQRLEVQIVMKASSEQPGRHFVSGGCNVDDKTHQIDGWNLLHIRLGYKADEGPNNTARLAVLVERTWSWYLVQVFSVFCLTSTVALSFQLLINYTNFSKRLVDLLKVVLTQTTFRFSIEHRLPKVTHWTPFDLYASSCQALSCAISVSFILTAVSHKKVQGCVAHLDVAASGVLCCIWGVWNLCFGVGCWWALLCERQRVTRMLPEELPDASGPTDPTSSMSMTAGWMGRDQEQTEAEAGEVAEVAEVAVEPRAARLPPVPPPSQPKEQPASFADSAVQRYDVRKSQLALVISDADGEASPGTQSTPTMSKQGSSRPQLISIAFRIWLVRNIDPVSGTFDCKFRVFLEWLEESACGLPKGQKAKEIPLPGISIANATQTTVLDQSSAPEVVNPESGHLAAQILYRATLKMGQEVQLFPFDVQWLAITVSLREGIERNRSFLFQYCEMDSQLQLDEWRVHPQPAFSALSKHDTASIQDTVMCGVIIRRNSRYYVKNIMSMLGLISSLVFAVYSLPVTDFWERAEVFLGIFPLIVVSKLAAQGKLPRVGYTTRFDRYGISCQLLFFIVVLGCMVVSMIAKVLGEGLGCASSTADAAVDAVKTLSRVEHVLEACIATGWVVWNVHFAARVWRVWRLPDLEVLRRKVKPQHQKPVSAMSHSVEEKVQGLAPRLQLLAQAKITRAREKSNQLQMPTLLGNRASPGDPKGMVAGAKAGPTALGEPCKGTC